MDSSSLSRSPDKHAQKLLSSTSFPCSSSIALSDPLLAPAGERPISGPASVKAALAIEHLFRQAVRVRAADFDEGTRVLTLETESTWALPVLGLVRLQSEGRTEFSFEDGDEGLVVGRIVNSESMDVVTAETLPKALAYPLALSLALLMPLLGSLVVIVSHAISHVRRIARRRPSGPVAAVINALDTSLIFLALCAVATINVGSWCAERWQGLVGDKGIVINISLESNKKGDSKAGRTSVQSSTGKTSAMKAKQTSLSSNVSSRTKQAENAGTASPATSADKHTELGLDERYPHHDRVVEQVSFTDAVKAGVEGLDERIPAGTGKPSQQNGNGKHAEKSGEGKKETKTVTATEERYPHHDHVIEEISMADAVKSGVAGLDPKVPTEPEDDGKKAAATAPASAKAIKRMSNGKADAADKPTVNERYPHHDHVVEEVNFADAIKSGVAGLDERVSVDKQ